MELNEKVNFKPMMGVMAAYPVSISTEEKNDKTLVTIKMQDSKSKTSLPAKFWLKKEVATRTIEDNEQVLLMDNYGKFDWVEKSKAREICKSGKCDGFMGEVRAAYDGELQLHNFFRALFNKKSIWLEENYPTNKDKGAQIEKFCKNPLSKEEVELFIKCKADRISNIEAILNWFDTYNTLCIVAVQPAKKDGEVKYYSNIIVDSTSVFNSPFAHYSPKNKKIDETISRLFGYNGKDKDGNPKYYNNARIKDEWIVSKSFGLVEYEIPTTESSSNEESTEDSTEDKTDDLPF